MSLSPGSFVRRHAQLRSVPGLEGIRLHLADDILPVWHAAQVATGDPDAPLPYWAVAWAGGLAIGRYLSDHPEVVAGRRVFDLASGSGLCAIAAMRAEAVQATAVDIDRFAVAAIGLNARANGVRVGVARRDVLDDDPPEADVILAGDCWYDAGLAARVLPWLRRAADAGVVVLVGDSGRAHLPIEALTELATYPVRSTTELEDIGRESARVFTLSAIPSTEEEPHGRTADR